ncbi:disulfide isomerase [Grosmannia clavigera kw1407]|uniref:protein disulfide-isomerase n=1 Tax=Grosmannia clavigera (strain kw1407 / UAMH 11150) TaxID=655863 RepID=F0XM39_GROCL|nr:disulfide isomerase [Grosmannia clavigera kw1407]EFX01396.1 disulfide isomerase [Grosmannia clavigera kw1407]
MVRLGALLIGGLAVIASAKSSVLDLLPSNFDSLVIDSGKPTLVEFFAPWCGHCKNLAPIYEDLADTFAFSDKVQIAKVDADAERSLGQRFGVQGFPTLKFFDGKSKEPVDYNSGRDLDSLSAFITEKTGVLPRKKWEAPSSIEFLTDESFAKVIGSDKDVLVAFTAPWCGHCKSLAPTWEKLATDFANEDGVVVAKVDAEAESSKQTAKDEGVTSYPTIKFFARGSKTGEAYSGARSEEELVKFINSKAGTHRTVGGGLDAAAGTVPELDNIVAKLASGRQSMQEAAEAAKKAANVLQADAKKKFAEYYVRVFDKLSKNEGFVSKELARLQTILSKGGLAPVKTDELTSKTNILSKFAENIADKEEEVAKDEL